VGGLIGMNANGLSLGSLYIIDHLPDLNWKVAGLGDLNGDGRYDVVWRNEATGEVYGLLMDGSAVLSEGTIYTEPNTTPSPTRSGRSSRSRISTATARPTWSGRTRARATCSS
jgi:hypothetical protein